MEYFKLAPTQYTEENVKKEKNGTMVHIVGKE